MTSHQLSILLVDDNKDFTERLRNLLGELVIIGEIKTAPDYEAAQKVLETRTPDLVLLDIQLPGKSGLELLKFIRRTGYRCRVMMVTNQADAYYRNLCRKLGADYFFDKTNDFSLIPEVIRNLKTP